jgi:putative copper export protein
VADLLVVARAIHFASSITVAGVALFPAAVAGEQLRAQSEVLAPIQRQLDWIVLFGLVLAVTSGAVWLLLFASRLEPATQDADSTFWLVLIGTQFGRVSVTRFLIAGLLAILIALRYVKPRLSTMSWLIALLGIAFVLSLAWCGHSGAGIGLSGDFQVGACSASGHGGSLGRRFAAAAPFHQAKRGYQRHRALSTCQTVLFAGNLGSCPAGRKRHRQHLVHDRWDAPSLRH